MTSKQELDNIFYITSSAPESLFIELYNSGARFQPDNNNYGSYSVCRARGPADLAIQHTIAQTPDTNEATPQTPDIQTL